MIIEINRGKIFSVEITPENPDEWDGIENSTILLDGKLVSPIVKDDNITIFIGDTEPQGKMLHGLKIYYSPFQKKKTRKHKPPTKKGIPRPDLVKKINENLKKKGVI